MWRREGGRLIIIYETIKEKLDNQNFLLFILKVGGNFFFLKNNELNEALNNQQEYNQGLL